MSNLTNTGSSYGPISKFFHWVIGILVILMLLVSYFLDDIPNKILKGVAFNAHKITGITILSLMVLRIFWVSFNRKPSLENIKLWERWAEKLVHWGLYLALLIMPMAGWVGSVAGGRVPQLYHIHFNLPIHKNDALSDFAFSVHNATAIIIITLLSIHVLAALYHYFFKKDNVLQRMLP